MLSIKTNRILEKKNAGNNIIITTEFWVTQRNTYPSLEKRDTVLSIFASIASNIESIKDKWFLFKGSDTALFTMVKGLGVRSFYYCGQYIPGVIHCKYQMEDKSLKSFFIVGGNIGEKEILISLIEKIKTLPSLQ